MENEKVLIQAGPSIQRILFGVIAGILLGGMGGLLMIFPKLAELDKTDGVTRVIEIIGGIGLIAAIVVVVRAFSCSVTVTNLRVYGKSFTKRVDFPIGQVSAVSRTGIAGIGISTSSGTIRFDSIRDANKVHQVLTELLNRNQAGNTAQAPVLQSSDADEIAKYKTLLDSGAITQEEYETKKKQLLGL